MSKSQSNQMNDTWEEGSTNVFADFEMPDADEKLAKADLTLKINQIIKKKDLTQKEAAKLLRVDQSKISLLNRGRLSDFSIERLVKYLILLDRDVEIVIKENKQKNIGLRLVSRISLRCIRATFYYKNISINADAPYSKNSSTPTAKHTTSPQSQMRYKRNP